MTKLLQLLATFCLGCFVVAAGWMLIFFVVSTLSFVFDGGENSPDASAGFLGAYYVFFVLIGVPVLAVMLILQGVLWLPVLIFAAYRETWVKWVVVAISPLAAAALRALGLIATSERLIGLPPFMAGSIQNGYTIEIVGLTATSIAFFVCQARLLRAR